MTAHVCGIELGKTVFHRIGLSKRGHIVIKKRFSRKQLLTCRANMPICLIGITVTTGPAHFSKQMPFILEDAAHLLSPPTRSLLMELRSEWEKLEEQIDAINRELAESA
jgi:hypothetical protein